MFSRKTIHYHCKSIHKEEKECRKPVTCPKCSSLLTDGYIRDVQVRTCEQCKGCWVSREKVKEILNIQPNVFTVDELKQFPLYYKPKHQTRISGYVPCPDCRQLMHRRNWGSHSGVIVDICRTHGTWFDEGEIDQIKEFIALGGIEYEKMMHAQRSINEITEGHLKKLIHDLA